HLLVLGQLGDRVLGLRRRGLRRGWRLRRWWLLPARRWLLPALLRVALRRVPLRTALRRGPLRATLLRVAALWWVATHRLLEPGGGTTGSGHAHAHEGQPVTAPALAGRLEPAGSSLLHERAAPGATQRIGLLHVPEQLAGVLVILDP